MSGALAVQALFEEKFKKKAAFTVRSPGRVNLLGEHTDYNLGFVLPMAIEQGTFLAFRIRSDSLLKIYSSSFEEWIEVDLSEPLQKGMEGHWNNYILGVSSVMQGMSDEGLRGMDVVIFSNLPIGASLSSSASLELAFARAFWIQLSKPWDSVLAARLCQRAEHEFAGVACGIMDQLACSSTHEGHAMLLDCRDMKFWDVPIPDDVVVAILDSGTRRKLSDGRYNQRRQDCEQAALILGFPSLREIQKSYLKSHKDILALQQYRRALHVIEENERVQKAFAAMKKGESKVLGQMMDEGHRSLRDLFEVSTPDLDWLVSIARAQKGCLGARITGAGFGGCAVAIVKKEHQEEFSRRVPSIYQERTQQVGSLYFSTPQAGCSLEKI